MNHPALHLTIMLALCASAPADVHLPNLFSDHMVLQRDKSVNVWGWAAPGEHVKVELAGKVAATTAGATGEWKVALPALPAGGPHELSVTGKNTLKVSDILVGEVWICSGQSNMEFELKHARNAQQEIKIYPLVPFAIRGALWYQGESNCGDGMRYLDKMQALIGGWRKVWQQGDFPFYFVQITPNKYNGALPLLLEAQNAAMAIPNTGMAASTDTCDASDNFGGGHPRNKQEIGRRLALWALAKDYGKQGLVYCGPQFKSLKAEGNNLRISFDHTGGGLMTRDNQPPNSFEIAGADGSYVQAVARIDGVSVVLNSDKVAAPRAVRFAWEDLAQPNLMNKEGLPVSVFRAELGK